MWYNASMTRKEYDKLCDRIWGLKGSHCRQCKVGYVKHLKKIKEGSWGTHVYNISY